MFEDCWVGLFIGGMAFVRLAGWRGRGVVLWRGLWPWRLMPLRNFCGTHGNWVVALWLRPWPICQLTLCDFQFTYQLHKDFSSYLGHCNRERNDWRAEVGIDIVFAQDTPLSHARSPCGCVEVAIRYTAFWLVTLFLATYPMYIVSFLHRSIYTWVFLTFIFRSTGWHRSGGSEPIKKFLYMSRAYRRTRWHKPAPQ